MAEPALKRIGIVGYGAIGRYLTRAILTDPVASKKLELAFVCEPLDPGAPLAAGVPRGNVLKDLSDFRATAADLVIEVAHPSISQKYGAAFMNGGCDYCPASVTAFADKAIETEVRAAAESNSSRRGLYIPAGALWGARDIQKMADRGSLHGLSVTMAKAPHHLKLQGAIAEKMEARLASGLKGECVLYEGPVRDLCSLAPNNVNTMAAAALAGHNLGFDGTVARLVMDTELEAHVVTVEVVGPAKAGAPPFKLSTTRYNPAEAGAVTGDATYASFLSSALEAGGRGNGVHFC